MTDLTEPSISACSLCCKVTFFYSIYMHVCFGQPVTTPCSPHPPLCITPCLPAPLCSANPNVMKR